MGERRNALLAEAADGFAEIAEATPCDLSSISAFVAQPNFFAYSVTKAGLLQMTRNMAMDLGPHKIRVNCVCPGAILTQAGSHGQGFSDRGLLMGIAHGQSQDD